jgi:hypothetical protein
MYARNAANYGDMQLHSVLVVTAALQVHYLEKTAHANTHREFPPSAGPLHDIAPWRKQVLVSVSVYCCAPQIATCFQGAQFLFSFSESCSTTAGARVHILKRPAMVPQMYRGMPTRRITLPPGSSS